MKIHIYVKTQDLDSLNKILSDPFSETNEEFEFLNTPSKDFTLISLTHGEWTRLHDMEALITILSL
jgi:hypothetical protein